ncbi:hypothetical protein CLV30_102171 [Haloactinopolyspora alba]|uniref:Uncharacterized protein n=1 Tax=Haloactinopolyspora alba TaxID=648780 RepID=A0A2P8EBE6_9ACTN|nr:hypothetical protein [Haloactinopolyspora alba]PSL06783.1 hypothetical protein CLV30_102171 [Haloactinopolyspora alba]
MATSTPLSSEAPSGDQLCDFVPRQSVVEVLGTEEFEVQGGNVSRDSADALSGAACQLAVDGDVVVSVMVGFMLGYAGNGFREGLYSWTDTGDDGPVTGEARLSRGDYLIDVEVVGIAEGRDAETDAVGLAQQVIQTLEIPDEWTLQGTAPSR